MIKLESINRYPNTEFYFNTIEECERFKYVFRNHWAGVKWKDPVNVSKNDIPYKKLEYMKRYKTPEEYAEANLKWGFNATNPWDRSEDKLSTEQESFIQMMMDRVTN